MFNETLTYSDGTTNHAYSTVVTGDYKRVRQVPGTALDQPELMTISHDVDEKKLISRSMVRFDKTIENALGQKGTISIYQVVVIPRDIAVLADVQKVHAQLHAFNGVSGNIDKLVNLES